jgi:hypothetical protein
MRFICFSQPEYGQTNQHWINAGRIDENLSNIKQIHKISQHIDGMYSNV